MRKAELLLLLLITLCSALIDPPIDTVMEHNTALAEATQDAVHANVFHVPEEIPTLGDPTFFFYAKILTLNPAVNGSVTGSEEDYHPELIWLVAENHASSVTEIDGVVEGYEGEIIVEHFDQPVYTWVCQGGGTGDGMSISISDDGSTLTEEGIGTTCELILTYTDSEYQVIEIAPPPEDDDDSCDRTIITRTYGDLEVDKVTAYYVVDGLAKKSDDGIIYETASETVVLADNETSFQNPSAVPFEHEGLYCMLTGFVSEYVLGGMVNLECGDPLLSRASPYAIGTYNATVRNLTIVKPRLNVTLYATFKIPYEEDGESCHETDEGCECDDWEDEGNITISSSDFKSYEVQNRYTTLIPYSPSFMNLSANTSENVIYYTTVLSNSELYKYYSTMDGKNGNAYYYQDFNLSNDAYGTQFIDAAQIDHADLFPEDPASANNYTGQRRILLTKSGNHLRSPSEINNMSYNYSNVYNIKEVYYNMTPGPHHADLLLYTWWGNYSVPSDIYSRTSTVMTVYAAPTGAEEVTGLCTLHDRWGNPLAGKGVVLELAGVEKQVRTDASGQCRAVFPFTGSIGTVTATFIGDDTYLAVDAYQMFGTGKSFDFGQGLVIDNPMLLLFFALLGGMAAMGILSAAGAPGGQLPIGKFFPFAKKPEGKKMIRKKSSKEIATQVVMALATGGAGAAAGSKIAEEVVKKKVAEEAAKKEMQKKIRMEVEKKVKKKAGKGGEKEKGVAVVGKKKGGKNVLTTKRAGAAGAMPEDDRRKRNDEIVKKRFLPIEDENRAKAEASCEKLGHPEWMDRYEYRRITFRSSKTGEERTYLLKRGRIDWQVVDRLESPTTFATTHQRRFGNEVRCLINMREDRIHNLSTVLPDGQHEHLHTVNKLDSGKCKPQVDGANEVMVYKDSIRKLDAMEAEERKAVLEHIESAEARTAKLEAVKDNYDRLRDGVEMTYEDQAAPQYMLKEIIGEDNYNVGHLVLGDEHLRNTFDKVAGKGEYDRIFGVRKDSVSGEWVDVMDDRQKLNELKEITKTKTNLDAGFVFDNVEQIKRAKRYDF
jgi:hypothetical protein